jgi:hypothetical protein
MDIVDLFAAMDRHQTKALARHEALLATMDERLAKQDQILAQLAMMIVHAREDATATRHMTTLAMQRFTDTRLDVDRFITTAERVLAAWERQQP